MCVICSLFPTSWKQEASTAACVWSAATTTPVSWMLNKVCRNLHSTRSTLRGIVQPYKGLGFLFSYRLGRIEALLVGRPLGSCFKLRIAVVSQSSYTQTFQYPLIKEYALNRIRHPTILQGLGSIFVAAKYTERRLGADRAGPLTLSVFRARGSLQSNGHV